MTDAATAPLRVAWGWGLASIHASDQVLDTYFPSPRLGIADDSAAPPVLVSAVVDDEAREVRTEIVLVEIDLDAAPAGTSDTYLRLHLLSHRLVRPRSINLDGIFGSLPNVVWTSAGPCAIEGFERVRTRLVADISPSTGWTSSRAWSTTWFRLECASPTLTVSGLAPTSPSGRQ